MPGEAVVGESIPIRATVFREGHDAVNASVVLTDPGGRTARANAPTTPLGSIGGQLRWCSTLRGRGRSGSKAGAILGRPGYSAEIKIPAGIDVALVCTEGKALFEASDDAEAAGDARAPRYFAVRPRASTRTAGGGPAGDRAGR